jgi:hypothetical protein
MTFAPIALADLPTSIVGAKAKEITPADLQIANAVAAIIASGNAARSGDAFATKSLAESAGRKFAAMLNKALPALPGGLVYRFRTLPSGTKVNVAAVAAVPGVPGAGTIPTVEAIAAVPAHTADGTTFAIVTGSAPKARGPRAVAIDEAPEVVTP